MIPDKIFKQILHTRKGYKMFLNGAAIEPGYKPDYVLRRGNSYVILESENSSSRKTFVGGMIKAAHYLQHEKSGILIFVIVPKRNTTAQAIASHLTKYFNWVKDKTNLKEVYVIEAHHYYNGRTALNIEKLLVHKHMRPVNKSPR
jgi:hypothetical protein